MDNKFDILFSKTECFSSDILFKYTNKELSNQDMHMVEAHLNSCPMCRDEQEGYEMLENKKKLPFIVSEINTKIDSRIKKSTGIQMRIKRIYAVAASVVLILGTSFAIHFFMNNGISNMADNMTNEPEMSKFEESNKSQDASQEFFFDSVSKISTQENELLKKDEENALNDNDKILQENRKQNTTQIGEEHEINATISTITPTDTVNVLVSANDIIIDEGEYDKKYEESSKVAAENYNMQDTGNESPLFRTADRETTNKEQIKKRDRENKKNVSATEAKSVAGIAYNDDQSNTVVAQLIFNDGFKFYEQNKYKDAVSKFDDVIKLQTSYSERAEWYKSLSLIELGKNEEALVILRKIVEKAGVFSQKAMLKIAEIEKK